MAWRWRRRTALLATVTTLALIGTAPPASADPPDAELVGGPTTGLLHDQRIDLVLHATDPAGIDVIQCGGPLRADCAVRGGANENRFALGQGIDGHTVAFALLAGRRFTSDNGEVDCLVTACTVRAVDQSGATIDELPLGFAATGTATWPTPTVRLGVTTTGVWNGMEIDVEGEGFSPFFHLDTEDRAVMQVCRGGADPDPATDCMTGMPNDDQMEDWLRKKGSTAEVLLGLRSDEDPVIDGTVDGTVYLWRYLDLPSGWFDCAPAACTLAFVQDGGRVATDRMPLTFGPEWRPYASPGEAVDWTTGQVLRRPLGTSERAALAQALAAGTASQRELVLAAATDPSVDRTVGEVFRQYVSHLGRFPEPGGYAYWIGRVEAGLAPDRLARIFAATPEATARYAGLSTHQKVETVYRATLGRAPDAAGAAFWAGKLDAGLPIWKLVFHFARSAELRARTADQVARAALVLGWFGATPDLVDWSVDPLEHLHFLLWFSAG